MALHYGKKSAYLYTAIIVLCPQGLHLAIYILALLALIFCGGMTIFAYYVKYKIFSNLLKLHKLTYDK